MGIIILIIIPLAPPWSKDSLLVVKKVFLPIMVLTPVATLLLFTSFELIQDNFIKLIILHKISNDSNIKYFVQSEKGLILSDNLKSDPLLLQKVMTLINTDLINSSGELEVNSCYYIINMSKTKISHNNVATIGLLSDITRIKNQNIELNDRTNELDLKNKLLEKANSDINHILTSIGDAFFALDKNWCFTYLNQKAEELFEKTKFDLIGHNLWSLFPGLINSDFYKYGHKAVEEKIPVKFEMMGLYHPIWAEVRVYPSADGVSVFFTDITEKKNKEEEIRRIQEDRVKIYERISDGFIAVDQKFRITYLNFMGERLIGKPFGELQGKVLWEEFPHAIGTKSYHEYYKALETNLPVRFEIASVVNKYLEVNAYPSAEGLTVFFKDITERKTAEELFYKAFNASPDIMGVTDSENYKIINVNEGFLRTFGYTRNEVIGNGSVYLNIIPHQEILKMKEEFKLKGCIHNVEVNLRTKHNTVRNLLISVDIIELNGRKCFLSSAKDITEQKQYEKEMVRLKRLDIINQMSSSLAHEIRNPLTTVKGFLQFISKSKQLTNEQDYLNLMVEEIDRANGIITEFLSLSRDKPTATQSGNLKKILLKIYPLLKSTALNHNQYLKLELNEVPDLILDEKEIRQLLLNLVKNALEATPENDEVKIKTSCKGEKVYLEIKDNGSGIPQEVLDNLGTPFNSTKETGTGLGLPVCLGIAKRHNAKMDIETGPSGTTITICFSLNQVQPQLGNEKSSLFGAIGKIQNNNSQIHQFIS